EVLGYKKGKEEWFEKGIEEGIKKGIEKGREEGIEKQKIVTIKRMYKKGYKIEDIAEIVDVSIKEICKIIKNGQKKKINSVNSIK
ncbi:MAG TPA: helix-turn-helix domain-containing protein, partial [bacterium]|nr:helix-turn-helix domain-containing protein [bacterium]